METPAAGETMTPDEEQARMKNRFASFFSARSVAGNFLPPADNRNDRKHRP